MVCNILFSQKTNQWDWFLKFHTSEWAYVWSTYLDKQVRMVVPNTVNKNNSASLVYLKFRQNIYIYYESLTKISKFQKKLEPDTLSGKKWLDI